MSLADELLADLDYPEDQEDLQSIPVKPEDGAEVSLGIKSARELAKLRDDPQLIELMREIDSRDSDSTLNSKAQIDGAIESHPEYRLVVAANNFAVRIGEDLDIIHKFCREIYDGRFPELDSLVPNALEYIQTVKELGNDLNKAKNNDRLGQFLTQATIMVVSVSASTTQGKPLPADKMDALNEAAVMAIDLNGFRSRIYQFVESRMTFIAPNLSIIVGASIAAKLMAHAGGLTALSKMPSCNVELLGNERKTLAGFSSGSVFRHAGIIFYSEIVQGCPPDLRRKAARMVAGKATIAARVDASHASNDGSIGLQFRHKIQKSLEKLLEPPPVKQSKALPAPIDQPGKKRGGRAARRKKERLAMTELRKAANRVSFATISEEAYHEDLSFSTGNMARGRVRAPQVDDKTKVRISKALQNKMKHVPTGTTSTLRRAVSGTQSTVAFTPMQALEIVNPLASDSPSQPNKEKYFANSSGFVSVINKR